MKYIKILKEKIENNYILYIINFLIIITWLIFIFFNLITQSRLIIFFFILFFIFIYKFLNVFSKIKIKNKIKLKFLILFNKYRNPILLLIIEFEKLVFNLLYINNNIGLKIFIYIIFLLIINPIKVFLYKFYKILNLWNNKKYNQIIINRMLGLILSILIFTNIIYLFNYILGISIFGLIYLYLLIVGLLSEYNNKFMCKNKILKIFLVHDFSLFNLTLIRLHSNLISKIINYNDIEEDFYYINNKNIYIIEKFWFGSTWLTLNSVKLYKEKPSYWLYFKIKTFLDDYLYFFKDYIYMDLNDWNPLDLDQIEFNGKLNNFSLTEFEKVKFIFNFDYKVFKLLLFLTLDLESYLGHNIKELINIEDDYNIIIFTCYKSILDRNEFFEKIKNINLKFGNYNENILIKLYPYLFYTKKSLNINYNENFLFYNKLYLILPYNNVEELKAIRNKDFDFENKKNYIKYIELLYDEWINIKNKEVEYIKRLKELEDDIIILKKTDD